MTWFEKCFLAATAALSLPCCAWAEDRERLSLSRALQADAKRFCEAPAQSGSKKSSAIAVTAKFDLGFLAKYLPVSMLGSLEERTETDTGILQAHRARAMNDTNLCRRAAFQAFAQFVSTERQKAVGTQGRATNGTHYHRRASGGSRGAAARKTSHATSPTSTRPPSSNQAVRDRIVQSIGQSGGVTAYSIGNVIQGQPKDQN